MMKMERAGRGEGERRRGSREEEKMKGVENREEEDLVLLFLL